MQKILDWVSRGFDQSSLEFVAPGSRRWRMGTGPVGAQVQMREASVLRRLLKNPEMQFGEAYMDGDWTPENGDLLKVLQVGLNISAHRERLTPFRRLRRSLAAFAERNTPHLSRRNVAHHYDLDNEFYKLFLDAEMHYSCAYFEKPEMTLEQAQQAKCAMIARKLNLKCGARVLDIGCGWGGLSLYLARHFNARVTGVTLSVAQHALALQRAKAEGLDKQVEFRLQDYRDTPGEFDAIVSVGMFEHVGRPQYQTYFDQINARLAPDGTALMHTIGRLSPPGRTNPWITKHIFPGGYIPAPSEVLPAIENSGLELNDLEVWRLHYAETLAEWNRRFQRVRGQCAQRFGERFCRMWEFYLLASEASFRADSLVVFHFQMAHGRDRLPLTRDYLYR
ncbi:MAG: cyclopropane-fatty-acyl-phospholipid synthase family protein [Nevskia sp.]|jgi:cyclopropane-fatty-acyl-phospholipid synthase|nr:cyclopropane-fatty-acyl-phospholipid synthase family protein [Nevskia sp.]MCK9384363.1 cyclopropane-fatty-acyl-phospholipid synthase family protein [Nevskia sp.]